MRYFLWLVFLLVSNYGNSQQVSRTFDKTLVQEEFESASNGWDSRFTAIELLAIQNDALLLKRLSSSGISTAFRQEFPVISKAEIITSFKISQNGPSSGGIVLWANPSGSQALLIEINEKGRFRIKKITPNQTEIISKSKKDGWIKPRGFRKDQFNIWTVKADNGIFDIYMNGKFQQTFSDQQVAAGRIGFFVGGSSSIEVDFLRINGAKDDTYYETELNQNSLEKADVLQIFRDKVESQQKEIQKLQQDLAYCKSMSGIDTSAQKANKELTTKNQELGKQIIALEQEMERMKKRLAYLESMKEDLEKSQNGDMIVNLTNLLAKEKKEHTETKGLLIKETEKNKELQKELESLKK